LTVFAARFAWHSSHTFYDQSGIVQDSIKSVRDAIFLGLMLSAIVLIVFLRDWGSSIVAGLVIPVTIFVTFIVLKLLGQSFNLMTLGGLAAAVGLVIGRCNRGGGKHRAASRRRTGKSGSHPERVVRDYCSADRLYPHADRSVSAADHHDRRNGAFFRALP